MNQIILPLKKKQGAKQGGILKPLATSKIKIKALPVDGNPQINVLGSPEKQK